MFSNYRSSISAVLIITAGYLFIYQLWYGITPMGMDPVLDGETESADRRKDVSRGGV